MNISTEVENLQEKLNWHWRNSMQTVRFFSFDARASLPIPLLLIYARWSTIILTILSLLFFRYLENKGLTFPSALRSLRSSIIGSDRSGWLNTQKRTFKDYG